MSNVRISESTHATLRSLAAEGGETMQAVLDKAVEDYRRRRFWDQVEAAAGDLRKDSAAWQEELAERRSLGRHPRRRPGGRVIPQAPARGQVWLIDLDPTRGHEQAGTRPGLVVSVDQFNQTPLGLAVVVPITSRAKEFPLHVRIDPPEGGLQHPSFAKCEDVRRLPRAPSKPLGRVSPAVLRQVEDRLRLVLGL